MKIEHIAIWTEDIERLSEFYINYFGARRGEKYINDKKQFQSYFLSFAGGSRIEVMQKSELLSSEDRNAVGYAHIAISVGEMKDVVELTDRLQKDGYHVVSGPRYTGDGYFESVVSDPDGNLVEITMD